MDSLTQAALGAAIGQATVGKKTGNASLVAGALIATIPDLDVFLGLFYSSVEMLRIHRGYSHSLVFCLALALPIAVIIRKTKWFGALALGQVYWFAFLCLVTHVLLDYCTAYGTQLLLPFSDARLGLDIVNVVDPVYTIPLLAGATLSLVMPKLKPHRFKINAVGLILSTMYLLFTLNAKSIINNRFQNDLISEGIEHNNLLTMPVGIASKHWYGVVTTDSLLYLKKYNFYSNTSAPFDTFQKNEYLLETYSPQWAKTMKWFSKGFFTVHESNDTLLFFNLQVDMRGAVSTPTFKAPTQGYFWSSKNNEGGYSYGSGSLQ